MGDSHAPSTQESTDAMMKAFIQNFPEYMRVTNAAVLPQAQTELAAAKSISPAYAELLNSLYSQYGKSMAETGVDVERINRTGAAQTDLDILKGSGGDLAKEAQKIDRELNPEFYKTREATSSKLAQLLGDINLDDPGVEAERLINQENIRSGNNAAPSATNTVANAISFGEQRSMRRNDLANAIGQATQFLQPSQSAFNPVVTALNRPSTNTGESRFGGVTNANQTAYNQGANMLGQIGAFRQQENDINSQRRDVLDRFNETTGSINS